MELRTHGHDRGKLPVGMILVVVGREAMAFQPVRLGVRLPGAVLGMVLGFVMRAAVGEGKSGCGQAHERGERQSGKSREGRQAHQINVLLVEKQVSPHRKRYGYSRVPLPAAVRGAGRFLAG